jgi:hypothetical protein
VWGVTGEIASYQIRPDQPRVVDGKALKYETPKGSRMVLDVPPSVRQWLGDPARPLFITEGARKADAGVSAGLCTIALLGVWNWRGTNDLGGKTALPDWEVIALSGRDVFIVFDSDVMTKEAVNAALARLKGFMDQRGANVKVIYLPAGESGTKTGLDDYLAAGHTVDDLLALATSELRRSVDDGQERHGAYKETPHGLVWNKPVGDGTIPVLLTNFRARIVAQVIEDDGVETRRTLEIRAELDGIVRSFTVPAASFQALNWAIAELGPRAIVSPGFGLRDHARTAIQFVSADIDHRIVYRHTGWRQIDGRRVYLHAGGGIGPEGPVSGVLVQLPPQLQRFELPAPSVGDALARDVREALGLLDVAPPRITFALLAAFWRALAMPADFALHLVGATGVFKSELAALVQRFLGPSMDARHLPGSWSSTDNALEAVASAAKDALLTIDDFAPSGSKYDIQSYHRKADRLFRAQGNNSGRARMRSDGTLVPVRPPRGLILSSGEDTPSGQSIRARLFAIEVSNGDVDLRKLTACQSAAADGAFARVTSAFLCWMAGQYEQSLKKLSARAVELRTAAFSSAMHARTPTIVAELQAGFELWLAFLIDQKLLDDEEVDVLRKRCWAALGEDAQAQSQHLLAAEPTSLFFRLLRAAIASGEAHLADFDGEAPEDELAPALGWRRVTVGTGDHTRDEWRPQGERVGWIDEEGVFLDPDAAHKASQEMASETERLAIGAKTLVKRLSERKLLVTQESAREKHGVRRQIQGARRYVLHVAASLLGVGALRDQEAHQPAGQAADATSGPEIWARNELPVVASGPPNGSMEPNDGSWERPAGPKGPKTPEEVDYARAERAAIVGESLFSAERRAGLFQQPTGIGDPEASGSVGGP